MNCNYDALFNKVGLEKLNKQVEVTIEALSDLSNCVSIKTNKPLRITPSNENDTPAPYYNARRRPDNQFECMPAECKTTGTMTAGVAGTVAYRAQFDFSEYAAGVVAFYVNNIDNATQTITFKIGNDKNFTNADVYEIPVSKLVKGKDGYSAVIVDLSSVPTSVVGEGWTANRNGAFVEISTDATMGLSTIAFYKSMRDFETSTVVKVGCLTELGTDFELEAAEETCFSHGYDDSETPTFERTITGNSVTPNYWILNPLMGRGQNTEGFVPKNVEKTIIADDGYGTVILDDINQDECGWMTVAMNDNCNIFDGVMYRLSVPSKVELKDEEHYFAVNNDDGTTTLYFKESLVGETVMVSYPKLVEVEEMVADMDNLGKTRYRYTETIHYTDGTEEVTVFDNVLITSFPYTINQDETEFSFTIRIQKAKNGHIMRKMRVLD